MKLLRQLCIAAVILTPTIAHAWCDYYTFDLSFYPVHGLGGVHVCEVDRHLRGSYLVQGLSETMVAVDIHGPSLAGEVAPILFTLPLQTNPARDVEFDAGPLSIEQWIMLAHQHLYVDVHTVEHPDGLLRGTIREVVGFPVEPITWTAVKSLFQ